MAPTRALSARQTQLLSDNAAAKPGSSVQPAATADSVKFRTGFDQRMTVPVTVRGTGPYRFLVDTGANRSAISSELAGLLRLARGTPVQLHSASGDADVPTVVVPQLQFSQKAMPPVEAALLVSRNMGADGILGTDCLANERVEFDLGSDTMSIVPARGPKWHKPGLIVVTARRRNGRLIVTDAFADGHRVTVLIDTGAQITIGNEALRRVLMREQPSAALEPAQIVSVTGGILTGELMFVKEVDIGGIKLGNLGVLFASAHTFHQLDLERRPALLLGMNAIKAFKKVSIDFAHPAFRVIIPPSGPRHAQF